jgi:UDPglucose--hexose-1-phosphate uridylyltransferase
MAKKKFPSELRLDLVSKDWVVIATGRAKRPETFKKNGEKESGGAKRDCPFCNIDTQEKPTLIFNKGKKVSGTKIPKDWTIIVVPNKYPAFRPNTHLEEKLEGDLYETMNAIGFHEVVVFKDHDKNLGEFTLEGMKEVFDVYQSRYLSLMKKKLVEHVALFHNHGKGAGASIYHPHSQIVTTPLVDVDMKRALLNSEIYHENRGECLYCQMNEWEKKVKKRIVFQNSAFQVICPFASKTAFQMIISPKKHEPFFEKISEKDKWKLAEAFKTALHKMNKALNYPDYNFYLHTAPCDGRDYPFYHYHWTIIPKTSTWAGFELGSRMEISTIEPEKAAAYLRKQ